MHIWGCLVEVRMHNPHEKKLDSWTVKGYFIGYLEKSKWYIFYCPNHSLRIVEIDNAKFLENGGVSRSEERKNLDIKEIKVNISLPIIKEIQVNIHFAYKCSFIHCYSKFCSNCCKILWQ